MICELEWSRFGRQLIGGKSHLEIEKLSHLCAERVTRASRKIAPTLLSFKRTLMFSFSRRCLCHDCPLPSHHRICIFDIGRHRSLKAWSLSVQVAANSLHSGRPGIQPRLYLRKISSSTISSGVLFGFRPCTDGRPARAPLSTLSLYFSSREKPNFTNYMDLWYIVSVSRASVIG